MRVDEQSNDNRQAANASMWYKHLCTQSGLAQLEPGNMTAVVREQRKGRHTDRKAGLGCVSSDGAEQLRDYQEPQVYYAQDRART